MNISIDVETTKKPYFLPWQTEASLVCISMCMETGQRRTWFFNHRDATLSPRECVDEINEWIGKSKRVIAHNLKFDYHWLTHIGVNLKDTPLYCTMVAEYLIRGHQKMEGLSLNDLCKVYGLPLKKDKVKTYWDAGVDTPQIDSDVLQVYCEQDCVNALGLFKRQAKQLKQLKLTKLFSLEMQSLPAYAEMEVNGMRLNVERLKKYQIEYDLNLRIIDKQLCELLGIENVGSGDQLSAGLFGGAWSKDGVETVQKTLKSGKVKEYTRKCTLKIPTEGVGFNPHVLKIPETKKEGVYETNVDVLRQLKPKTQEQKQVVELLFERSRMAQMKSTYFDGLLKILIDEYAHPTINQALTKTGRTSCARPNLQNQPRGNTGPVKECFITRY